MTSYQSTRSQSSHEDRGPSVGRLTPRPPDPSATLRDTKLSGAVAQCVIHDTASQDRALWHTESKVMFKGEEKSKHVTQQGLSRDSITVGVNKNSTIRRADSAVQCTDGHINAAKYWWC